METIDQLRIVIQIAISLAGFSGIVASFQYREGSNITRGDTLGLVLLVNMSLVSAFFAVLPIVLFNFNISESTVWGVCSGLIAINYSLFVYYIRSRSKQVRVLRTVTKITHSFLYILCILTIIMNLLNSLDVAFHREYPPYFVSLLIPLITSGYLFARLVSRPLWRAIRLQEKNKLKKQSQ